MTKAIFKPIVILAMAAIFGGCSDGISRQIRNQVSFFGTFNQLQQNPESYVGKIVIFGGKIIKTEVNKNSTDILVLQLALDSSDRPENLDESSGRFIIRTNQFLDPALYPDQMLITVVGKVTGSQEKQIGKMPYRYPVIEPLEIKKWRPEAERSPRFHFGIGVGTTF